MKISRFYIGFILFAGLSLVGSNSYSITCQGLLSSAANKSLIQQTLSLLQLASPNKSIASESFKSCGPNCIEFNSSSDFSYQIRFVEEGDAIDHFKSRSQSLAFVPRRIIEQDGLVSLDNLNAIRRFLVGHQTHPFIKIQGSEFLVKEAQEIGLSAFMQAVSSGSRSFLNIGPTSVGKSFVQTSGISHLAEARADKKLSIIFADRVVLKDQWVADLSEQGFSVNTFKASDRIGFEDFLKSLNSKNSHEVIVLTTNALKELYWSLSDEQKAVFHQQINGLFLDEAHHLGAAQTFELVEFIMGYSDAIFFGSTATPIHANVDIRKQFDALHWMYLNDENNLFEDHPIESILDQLAIGIKRGEITPFDSMYFLGPPQFDINSDGPLFIKGETQFYVLNPDHYQKLIDLSEPVIKSNEKGFIVAATIPEAERIKEAFGRSYPNVVFDTYHSDLSLDERQRVLTQNRKEGLRHFIISVKALDEGLDIRDLSAYIDINTNVPVKQFIQRIGRILRLAINKQDVDILFLSEFRNSKFVSELLELIDQIKKFTASTTSLKTETGDQGFLIPESDEKRIYLEESIKIMEAAALDFWNSLPKRKFATREAHYQRMVELGIGGLSRNAYREWFKENGSNHPELYSEPWKAYSVTWAVLTGGVNKLTTYQEHYQRMVEVGVGDLNSQDYPEWYRENRHNYPELYAEPQRAYGVSWFTLTGGERPVKLATAEAHHRRMVELGIGSLERNAYREWFKENGHSYPELYSEPWKAYNVRWGVLIGKPDLEKVSSYIEQQERMIEIGIDHLTRNEYVAWFVENKNDHPDLYSDPAPQFGVTWGVLTGRTSKLETPEDHFVRMQALGIAALTKREYKKWFEENSSLYPELYADPWATYGVSVADFRGEKNMDKASTAKLHRDRMRELGIDHLNRNQYRDWFKDNGSKYPDLYSEPWKSYGITWRDFSQL